MRVCPAPMSSADGEQKIANGAALPSWTSGSTRFVTRKRQLLHAGPLTVHGSEPSFGVLAKSVSQVSPPSRDSSMLTVPPVVVLQVMPWAVPIAHRSPPFGCERSSVPLEMVKGSLKSMPGRSSSPTTRMRAPKVGGPVTVQNWAPSLGVRGMIVSQ